MVACRGLYVSLLDRGMVEKFWLAIAYTSSLRRIGRTRSFESQEFFRALSSVGSVADASSCVIVAW
jgi:hypothetical protein